MSKHNGHSPNGYNGGGGDDGGHNGGHDDHDNDSHNIVNLPSRAEREAMKREEERVARAARRERQRSEPLINLPPVTKIMLGLFVGIHVALVFMTDQVQQYWIYEHFGLVTGAYTGHAPLPLWSKIIGPVTFMFLHGSWMHLAMNGFMMMAFGAGLERWMGGKRLLTLFFACGLASGAVQFAFDPTATGPVIGASGGLSGFFAAVLIMMQQNGMGSRGRYGILPFVIIWIVISVVFGMMGGPDGSIIAWPAHIGGFLAGFLFMKPIMKMRV